MESRLFTVMVNIGMYGVHKDIHETFEVNDVFNFELPMFENTNDANLGKLIDLIKATAKCRDQLMNLNAIRDDEVESFDSDPTE